MGVTTFGTFARGPIDLKYIHPENMRKVQDDLSEIERMMKALIKSLENKGVMDSKKQGAKKIP